MIEEKRSPTKKPLVVPLTFNEALTMIAMGGKPEIKTRTKTVAKGKKKVTSSN